MKKIVIAAAIIIGSLFGLLIAGKISGAFTWVRVSTISNEPGMYVGEIVFCTFLKKPVPGNFILYKNDLTDSLANDNNGTRGNIFTHRLCGIPGDIIEMKNGVLYVNKKNFDEPLLLNSYYKISKQDFIKTHLRQDSLNNKDHTDYMEINDSSLLINMDNKQATILKSKIAIERFINTDTTAFSWLAQKQGFTVDNFGPLKVPADCYFVLGDNRHNALDSRYCGFIPEKNCKGVVLGK